MLFLNFQKYFIKKAQKLALISGAVLSLFKNMKRFYYEHVDILSHVQGSCLLTEW